MSVTTTIASDYATADAGNYSFYYGYEEKDGEEWAFVAKKCGYELMRLGTSKLTLGADGFDVAENLIAGLAIFIDTFRD